MATHRPPVLNWQIHMSSFGTRSSTAPLKHVQLIPPGQHQQTAYQTAAWLPNKPSEARDQFQAYVHLLEAQGVHVSFAPPAPPDNPDAIYAYDNALILPAGAIVYRSCKANRQNEWRRCIQDIQNLNIPILGQITTPGSIDGGDVFWLDANTLAAGLSWRTNQAGIDQLKRLVAPFHIQVQTYDLPNVFGSSECLHLMSLVSPLTEKFALVDDRFIPVRLVQDLQNRGVELIPAEPTEFDTLATNVLALGHNRVIALSTNPKTLHQLESRQLQVSLLEAFDLCVAGTGGPTCLTRIIWRANTEDSVS